MSTKKTKTEQATTGSAVAMASGPAAPKPIAVLDGPCITSTLRRIRNMPEPALASLRSQSEELLGQVLDVYARDIAPGEVGRGGSAVAGPQPVNGLGPTGLLYGRIQSGKTVTMVTFTALAIDNGFRIIVVLTTNLLELVKQTKDRFNDLGSVLVRASIEPEEWSKEAEIEHLRKTVPHRGLVLVCAKHAGHLENVLGLLEKDGIGGGNYPALILDDEADQASLDNKERQRGRSKNPDAVEATAVNQAILDIRKELRHHVFLQVTARPYALLLQRVDSPLRPKFTYVLGPGSGYIGGEDFFSLERISGGHPHGVAPLVFIREEESQEIDQGPTKALRGLEDAITFFLIAAAAQAIRDPEALGRSQNFFCHTSHKRTEQDKLHNLIIAFTSALNEELVPLRGRAKTLVTRAYGELGKTVPDLPPLADILDDIVDRLPRRKVRVVSSGGKSGEEVRGAPNFIIGGNIVDCGLTIANLLVTYYVRRPKSFQKDAVLQQARMFGYRRDLMPYTRVFLPRSLAVRFWRIHEAEEELRNLLLNVDAVDQVPVRVVGRLRATSYGVLDTGSVVTVGSGKHLYPTFPDTKLPKSRVARIEELLGEVWPGWNSTKEYASTLVPLQTIESLLGALSPAEWDVSSLSMILRSVAGEGGKAHVAYQPMDPGKNRTEDHKDLATGALSGPALDTARSQELPTLFLFRQLRPRACWDNDTFFYPTIVFPRSMPHHVYNDIELD